VFFNLMPAPLFICLDGQKVEGPFSETEVAQAVSKGTLTSDALVCVDGSQTWVKLGSLRPTLFSNQSRKNSEESRARRTMQAHPQGASWWQRFLHGQRVNRENTALEAEAEEKKKAEADPEDRIIALCAQSSMWIFALIAGFLVAAYSPNVPKATLQHFGLTLLQFSLVGVGGVIGLFIGGAFGMTVAELRKQTQADGLCVGLSVIFSILALPLGVVLAFCALSSPANRYLGLGLLLLSFFASAMSLILFIIL